jgi:hypothetical protein
MLPDAGLPGPAQHSSCISCSSASAGVMQRGVLGPAPPVCCAGHTREAAVKRVLHLRASAGQCLLSLWTHLLSRLRACWAPSTWARAAQALRCGCRTRPTAALR